MQWVINIVKFLFFERILSGNVILSPVNESVVLDGWSGKKKNVLATIDYGEDQKGHLRLFIDKFKQQLTEPTDIETTTPPVDEITGNSFAAAAAGKIPSWAALEYVLLGFLRQGRGLTYYVMISLHKNVISKIYIFSQTGIYCTSKIRKSRYW